MEEKLKPNTSEVPKTVDANKQKEKSTDESFSLIKKYFSQYKTQEDLPKSVLTIASENSISLFDALLRFNLIQSKKAEAEKNNQLQNKSASACSQKSKDGEQFSDTISAMLKGVRA